MSIESFERKCKDCSFYSGVICHGHGEFWGNCKLLKLVSCLDSYISTITYKAIVYDESTCLFQTCGLVNFYRKVESK